MDFLVRLWVTFQFATLISVVVAIPLSFKYPGFREFPLLIGSIVHILTAILNLRSKPAEQSIKNFLLLNFSAHVVAMNVLFLFCGGAPIFWKLALGMGSLYQVLGFLCHQVFPAMQSSTITRKLTQFYWWLTQPPRAQTALATLEIVSLIGGGGRRNVVLKVVKLYAYVFGHILYRYSADPIPEQIWAQQRQSIVGLIMKLPTAIGGILLKAVDSFAMLGEIGKRIYRAA
jgi:hypothetical protein